jgi:hypothetical protein
MEDAQTVGSVLEDRGIKFSFPNLKNLAGSEITYPQFLACVAQRILLKQYAAQTMDPKNLLCSMSRASEVFNSNKKSFSTGINELFLKPMTLSVINSQTSKNKVTKEEQSKAAVEFVKWYSSFWFIRLKSEEMLNSLEDIFSSAEAPDVKESSNDWDVLAQLFSGVNDKEFFDVTEMDSQVFINKAESMDPKWFDEILASSHRFMELAGNAELPLFEGIASDGDLLVPTTSAFMTSTLYGIEEVEDRVKRYNAPLDPYNLFHTFRGTSMSHLLKMNQFVFTVYNYFKILL